MRLFVTGATGFIGTAVVKELLSAGHQVVGLARNDSSANKLTQAGAEVHRGELSDVDSIAAGAASCDGTIHLAFIHDFSQYDRNGEIDRNAVSAMVDALAGSNKPLVITSGLTVVSTKGTITEDDVATRDAVSWLRGLSESIALKAADKGVRSSIVRLPPSVHGKGDKAFVPALIEIARRTGISAYVGDGANRWPAVHRFDAARLYRLAAESAPAGSCLHGVAEEGIIFREIAEAIGRGLNLPVLSISEEKADDHFGWIAKFAMADSPASSQKTRDILGWKPIEMELATDMEASNYFRLA